MTSSQHATPPAQAAPQSRRVGVWLPVSVLALTVAQLALATFVDLPQFEGKAFGSRLVAYPLLMAVAPALWWWVNRRTAPAERVVPHGAFALVMAPFLIDVTGNSFDLYDSITWWDDANHFVNWFLLLSGIGLLIGSRIQPRWALVVVVVGSGAVLAIGWELAEYYAFIRNGTELDTAYVDTLGDEALGTLGALLAGLWVRSFFVRRQGAHTTSTGVRP